MTMIDMDELTSCMLSLSGRLLQATLEIEFMHQTLSQHVSPLADATLQSIYKTISQSYYRRPTPNSATELQAELEGLKRTLVASRRATTLQFLCFRAPSKSLGAKSSQREKDRKERNSAGAAAKEGATSAPTSLPTESTGAPVAPSEPVARVKQ